MKTILAGAAALGLGALAFAAPAAAQQDILAPARTGQLQCYAPDRARKTCGAMISYRLLADGSYENQALVLVARQPTILMYSATSVVVRDGAVCGGRTREHLQAARFIIDGQPASEDNAAFLREQVAQMPSLVADEICTTYTQSGDALRADLTINGAPSGGESSTVIWVRPDEGYTVAP